MVSPDKRSFEIANAFTRYLESKDKSLVERYTREEIEIALLQFLNDMDNPYYAAMQVRRDELKEMEEYRRERHLKWKNRMFVFIAGSCLGLALIFLKLIFFS